MARRPSHVPVPGFGGLSSTVRRLPPLAPPLTGLHVRCLASKSGGDKSWSDIAAEAAQLGTDLVKKVGTSVSNAMGALVPSEKKSEQERVQRRESERRRRDVYRPEDADFGGGLVAGLLGKAVGSMLRSAVGVIGEQLQEAQEQVADVQERAARIIESNSKLRQKMGDVQVRPAMSQSSSTSVINGRMSRRVTLVMPVVGAGGRVAQAQVQYVEGDNAAEQLGIVVRLANGEVVELDGSSSPGGQVIDVDWKSVDEK